MSVVLFIKRALQMFVAGPALRAVDELSADRIRFALDELYPKCLGQAAEKKYRLRQQKSTEFLAAIRTETPTLRQIVIQRFPAPTCTPTLHFAIHGIFNPRAQLALGEFHQCVFMRRQQYAEIECLAHDFSNIPPCGSHAKLIG